MDAEEFDGERWAPLEANDVQRFGEGVVLQCTILITFESPAQLARAFMSFSRAA